MAIHCGRRHLPRLAASAALAPLGALPSSAAPPTPPVAPPPAQYTLAGPLTTRVADGPAWARGAPLYQAYPHDGWSTGYQEGSYFRRTEALLPALKEMGVGVVWLLPVHPRGPAPGALPPPHIAKGARFQSQSPYCVRDYYAVDPHWGTPADLHRLVRHAHALGLRVMMDMVLNHTSWGNPLLVQHPEFYKHDADGNIVQAGPWTDIAQLDYGSRAVWEYMARMLTHWVRDYDVDGFRMDAVSFMPQDFWRWLRPRLLAVKPVLLLAEEESPRDYPAFDMTYHASLYPLLWGLAGHGADDQVYTAAGLDALLLAQARAYPPGATPMNHLDNHDLHPDPNPWLWGRGAPKNLMAAGTVLARYGAGYRAFRVLTATLPGRPMVYNGEELYRPGDPAAPPVPDTPARLRAAPNYAFFRRLLCLYRDHPALQRGAFTKIPSGRADSVYAFVRARGADRVLVVLNLSGAAQAASLRGPALPGRWREVFTGAAARLGAAAPMRLAPWAYRMYAARP